jgi:hypothetical protein
MPLRRRTPPQWRSSRCTGLHCESFRNAQAFGAARQDAHPQFLHRVLTVPNGTVRRGKRAGARRAGTLPPGATTGMTIGAQVVQSPPAALVTLGVGTKVSRGIPRAGAAVRWRHGSGPHRRRWSGLPGSCAPNAPCGVGVRPANGWGAREGGRWSLLGSAGLVGLPRGARGQRRGSPTHNQRRTMGLS